MFETLFFAAFLGLYYAVLVRRDNFRITIPELLLYVWIASFAYDEFADWVDAGQTSFYASDFWYYCYLCELLRCYLTSTGGHGT